MTRDSCERCLETEQWGERGCSVSGHRGRVSQDIEDMLTGGELGLGRGVSQDIEDSLA